MADGDGGYYGVPREVIEKAKRAMELAKLKPTGDGGSALMAKFTPITVVEYEMAVAATRAERWAKRWMALYEQVRGKAQAG